VALKPITTLREVMQVRRLRNSCREYLTNYQNYISRLQQLIWYFFYFRRDRIRGKYRLYLCSDDRGLPVGYGALSLEGNDLLITECVATEYRGRGYGRLILEQLVRIAREEKRNLVAEIWSTNELSIALHEKAGFKLADDGKEKAEGQRKYVLSASAIVNDSVNPIDRSRIVA
jgi:RimJ/RimL family protein N-acetyltransferase